MTKRRYRIAAVVAALVACCLAFSLWIVAGYRGAAPSRAVSSVLLEPHRGPRRAGAGLPAAMLSVATPLAACEARIKP